MKLRLTKAVFTLALCGICFTHNAQAVGYYYWTGYTNAKGATAVKTTDIGSKGYSQTSTKGIQYGGERHDSEGDYIYFRGATGTTPVTTLSGTIDNTRNINFESGSHSFNNATMDAHATGASLGAVCIFADGNVSMSNTTLRLDRAIEMKSYTSTLNIGEGCVIEFVETLPSPNRKSTSAYIDVDGRSTENGNGFHALTDSINVIYSMSGKGTVNYSSSVKIIHDGHDDYVFDDDWDKSRYPTLWASRSEKTYSTYYQKTGAVELSAILTAAEGEDVNGVDVSTGATLTMDAEATNDLTVSVAEAAHLVAEGTSSISEIAAETEGASADLVMSAGSSLTITTGKAAVSMLTLNSGAEIIIGTDAEATHDISLTSVMVNDTASITGDLVMDGATLTFTKDAALTMGGSVTLSSENGITIVLAAEQIELLEAGKAVNLFTNVSGVTLGDKENITFMSADHETLSDIRLETVETSDGKSTIRATTTPEPATATLSLLALAGLAARRKRH